MNPKHLLVILCLVASLSGCAQYAANKSYDDVAAAATADKQECAKGDQQQCEKFAKAQDHCREMIARGDKSASAIICERLANEGIISSR